MPVEHRHAHASKLNSPTAELITDPRISHLSPKHEQMCCFSAGQRHRSLVHWARNPGTTPDSTLCSPSNLKQTHTESNSSHLLTIACTFPVPPPSQEHRQALVGRQNWIKIHPVIYHDTVQGTWTY